MGRPTGSDDFEAATLMMEAMKFGMETGLCDADMCSCLRFKVSSG